MARKQIEIEETQISKAWLDSYADAITLLMAFFVMLFAFSLVDKKKFDDFKFGVAEAFGKPNPTVEGGLGLLDRGTGIATGIAFPPIDPKTQESDAAEGEFQGKGELTVVDFEKLADQLNEQLTRAGVGGKVEVERDPRGLIIHLDDDVLFDSGSALIKIEGTQVLNGISDVLRTIDNLIIIEGHTDNVPTSGTRWPTNWELSVARATHVLRWLVEARGVPAPRTSAAGYADTRPRASNLTADGRQKNRRVEIVVVLPEDTATNGQDAEA